MKKLKKEEIEELLKELESLFLIIRYGLGSNYDKETKRIKTIKKILIETGD